LECWGSFLTPTCATGILFAKPAKVGYLYVRRCFASQGIFFSRHFSALCFPLSLDAVKVIADQINQRRTV
jgi:hypothetical protein